jgi:hypothetical protein
MTVTSWTYEHYNRPEIRDTILSISREGTYSRWGNGDGHGWYKQESEKKKAYNLGQVEDYTAIIKAHRTLYWTLNLFDRRIYDIDYNKVTDGEESPLISRQYTQGYTLGVDIDKGHGCNIHDPEVKKAVEDMGQFYTDKLRQYAPNSVHVLFSGGGIYVLLHHSVLEDYFRRYTVSNEWEHYLTVLLDAYGFVIDNIREEFFKLHPEHIGKVKPDSLNNSKRVFKSLFSIHLKHPYAVIPLNPDKIIIDFDRARLPLSREVIESGNEWYRSFDNDNKLLQFLRPYLEKAEHEANKGGYSRAEGKPGHFDKDKDMSNTPVPCESWPPCIKNILALPSCGEGRTRALAFIAAFMGQMGIPEDQARSIFESTARKWGATTSNVFKSNYVRMKVATCDKLRANDNTGYPKGVSIRELNVCKPDPRCINCVSPRYYADKRANLERLKARLK